MSIETTTKKCPACNTEKLLSEFYKAKNRKHGVEGYCKKCKNKKGTNWSRRWRKRNSEYVRKRNQKYRLKNRDKVLQWRKNDRVKNKEHIIQQAYLAIHRRRARRNSASGRYTLEEWNDIKSRQRYSCLACKRTEPAIVLCQDHIIPLSKGGSNYISNIQGLCKNCNSAKGSKIISIKELQYIIGQK